MTSKPSEDEVLVLVVVVVLVVSVAEAVTPEADGIAAVATSVVLTAEVNVVDTVASSDTAVQR